MHIYYQKMTGSKDNLMLTWFYESLREATRFLLAATLVCLGSLATPPLAAGIGKDLEACEAFYGQGELASTEMLHSGMFGDVEKILANNPDCQIYLFRDSRPFSLLTMAFFTEGKGELFTYMRLTETDGLAGTGPLSDAEIEALLVLNQSGGPWKKQEKGVVEPVKAMWLSGDGKYLAAYNDTGAMRALNIMPLKFIPAAAGSASGE
jgi:hypothetical protein